MTYQGSSGTTYATLDVKVWRNAAQEHRAFPHVGRGRGGRPRAARRGRCGGPAPAATRQVACRALAIPDGRPRILPAHPDAALPAGRLGIGPAVPVLDLPRSWAAARIALRLTADGTAHDPGPPVVHAHGPGPPVVHADGLGYIALLAGLVAPGAEVPPDVRVLKSAAAHAPWVPATLHAVASTTSLRAAAAEINVHHSTLQDRLTHAETLLGRPVRTPQGRFRLQLALMMHLLARL